LEAGSVEGREAAAFALEAMKNAGSEKAVATAGIGEVAELNIEAGKITLLRSTFNTNLGLKVLTGGKKGTTSINKLDTGSIRLAAEQAVAMANASEPDEANEISEYQKPGRFEYGARKPDLDLMYERLEEFRDSVKTGYPDTILEQAILKFRSGTSWFLNSNGVDFETRRGLYEFEAMFTTKKGGKSSSFNDSGYSTNDLDRSLLDGGTMHTRIRQNSGQVDTNPVAGKFVGETVVTPDCLMSILRFITRGISDIPLITGTSVFKDSLDTQIASSDLTMRSAPLSNELVERYFVTGDGYTADNCTIVERGVLSSFLLSLYGARKTGMVRALSSGGCYIVEPGLMTTDDLVKSVKRGVLVCRISGGHPGINGDFSAIAKNSYLIENGEITKPLSETMISGNMVSLLHDIEGVSSERVNFGGSLLPWVMFSGVTISGK
jgi:PmbA protein